jgi:hypothetical protein
MVLALLRSPLHGVIDGGLCELRYQGPRTGTTVALPVGYARDGDRLVVLIGDAPHKRWWRTFLRPYPIEVRLNGELHAGRAHVIHPDHPSTITARTAYLNRHHVSIRSTDRLLLIEHTRVERATTVVIRSSTAPPRG